MGSLIEEFLRQECPELWVFEFRGGTTHRRRIFKRQSGFTGCRLAAISGPLRQSSSRPLRQSIRPSRRLPLPRKNPTRLPRKPFRPPSALSFPTHNRTAAQTWRSKRPPANNANADGFTVVKSRKKGKKRPATDSDPKSQAAPSNRPTATPAKKAAASAQSEPTFASEIKPPPPIIIQDKAKWHQVDIRTQGYPVHAVRRLRHPRTRVPMDMVMVELDPTPEGKAIFNLKRVCGLSDLVIEPPRKSGVVAQFHNCQHFGHTANNCFAHPRCVKCTGDHGTTECTRPKDCADPPDCVNCHTTGHPASYRGCAKAPKTPARKSPAKSTLPKPAPVKYIPAPVAVINAWAKPQVAAQVTAPVIPVASRQLPASQTAPRPQVQPIPSVFAENKDDPFAQIANICSFLDRINRQELAVLSAEIAAATSGHERLRAISQHKTLVEALWAFTSQP
ncbi:unnamed protein product, partial [Iphiclides podalirius]